jgi:hypothetical protein
MAGSNLNGEADERVHSAAEPANQALLEEVGRIGFLPFILVGADSHAGKPVSVVACKTQNEAGQFVNELGSLRGFAESKLLRSMVGRYSALNSVLMNTWPPATSNSLRPVWDRKR